MKTKTDTSRLKSIVCVTKCDCTSVKHRTLFICYKVCRQWQSNQISFSDVWYDYHSIKTQIWFPFQTNMGNVFTARFSILISIQKITSSPLPLLFTKYSPYETVSLYIMSYNFALIFTIYLTGNLYFSISINIQKIMSSPFPLLMTKFSS